MPKLRKPVMDGLRSFYELITHFRGVVNDAVRQAEVALVHEDEDEDEDEDIIRLRMVSTELRRRLRDTTGRDPEGDPRIAEGARREAVALGGEPTNDHDDDDGDGMDMTKTDAEGGGLAALMRLLLYESGYEDMLDRGGEEEAGRWRNLGELANLARERSVDELGDFLDQVALVSDVDGLDGQGTRTGSPAQRSAVQLSTIHGAKGLEFSHVFVAGVEEDLLPHYYCADTQDEVEQERRLLCMCRLCSPHPTAPHALAGCPPYLRTSALTCSRDAQTHDSASPNNHLTSQMLR